MTEEDAPSDKKEGAAEAIENNIRRKMVEKVAGTPEQVAEHPTSYTGKYVKQMLERQQSFFIKKRFIKMFK